MSLPEGEDMYGDGVNIAARIEGLADPGGICISRNIYDQIRKKVHLGFEYLGEQRVKNISEPIRVYKLLVSPEDVGKLLGDEKSNANILRWGAAGRYYSNHRECRFTRYLALLPCVLNASLQ